MGYKITWLVFWVTMMYWLGGLWGCAASGDEQNYELLEQDDAMFQDDTPGLQSRAEIGQELGVQVQDQPAALALENQESTQAGDTVDQQADQTDQAQEIAAPEVPALEATARETVTEVDQDVQAHSGAAIVDLVLVAGDQTDQTGEVAAELDVSVDDQLVSVYVPETEPTLLGLDRSNWKKLTIRQSDQPVVHNPIYFRDAQIYQSDVPNLLNAPADAQYDQSVLLAALGRANINDNDSVAIGLVVQPVAFALDFVTLPIKVIFQGPWDQVTTP